MKEILCAAQWTPQNCHLQTNLSTIINSPHHNSLKKIQLCFQRSLALVLGTLLFPLRSLTLATTLPSSTIPQHEYQKIESKWLQRWDNPFPVQEQALLKRAYEPASLNMISPDGALIKGVFYKHLGSSHVDIPTIVCFNHNRALAKTAEWDWLLKKGAKSSQPFNVIVFDYRPHVLQTDELLVDGETVVQTTLTGLGITPSNVHYFGFSIGGAISALIADLHPGTGRVVNRSSFLSLDKVALHSPEIHESLAIKLFSSVPQPLLPLVWNRGTKWFTTLIGNGMGFNLDPSHALKRLKERLLVVYHPQDRLIPPAIGAIAANGNTSQNLQLKFKPTVTCQARHFDYHLAPLKLFEQANRRVLNFILSRDVFLPRAPHPRKHYCINPQGIVTQGLRY